MSQTLSRAEVVEVTGLCETAVKERAAELAPEAREIGRNGKPEPRYPIEKLPAQAQLKWASTERQKVVEIAPANDAQIHRDSGR